MTIEDRMPNPDPNYPSDRLVFPLYEMENFSLRIRRQGYGADNGSGELVICERDFSHWEEECIIVKVSREDNLHLYAHLDELFCEHRPPPSDWRTTWAATFACIFTVVILFAGMTAYDFPDTRRILAVLFLAFASWLVAANIIFLRRDRRERKARRG